MKTVNVTKRDIEKGVRESGNKCPIALALRRQTKKGENYLDVGEDDVLLGTVFYKLPPKARIFIKNFDSNNKLPRPFRFRMVRER